ncbi:hypothetical protein [Mycobacterium sp. 852002-51961_SCH5331710]|uniref:hypothetical protein n=1 Tax=Mycobacterium sp. 852002-51961_SCH5331710 TaxID=1834105 RepID=UPI0007FDB4EB|nr:hypothetical protein [Mycobacterium sp. 852002-51961_SCH5331710]OBB36666.1 hypothetical protein A5752_16225 [Mycobacterium sp. 852002-51961_SCH5331710]
MRSLITTTAAAAAAVAALATATNASALPEWDIGEYDSCIAKVADRNIRGVTNDAQMLDEAKHCCLMSGGEWDISAGGPAGKCVAPAAESQWTPPGGLPENVPPHTFEPARPASPTQSQPILTPPTLN